MVSPVCVFRAVGLAALLAAAGCVKQSAPLAPSNGPFQLSGTISSMAGGPIAGAHLVVITGANKDKQTLTDSSGHYSFTRLESGRFTVVIEAPGFVSVTPVVDLFRDIEANFGLFSRQ
jgi:hypothetical protein